MRGGAMAYDHARATFGAAWARSYWDLTERALERLALLAERFNGEIKRYLRDSCWVVRPPRERRKSGRRRGIRSSWEGR